MGGVVSSQAAICCSFCRGSLVSPLEFVAKTNLGGSVWSSAYRRHNFSVLLSVLEVAAVPSLILRKSFLKSWGHSSDLKEAHVWEESWSFRTSSTILCFFDSCSLEADLPAPVTSNDCSSRCNISAAASWDVLRLEGTKQQFLDSWPTQTVEIDLSLHHYFCKILLGRGHICKHQHFKVYCLVVLVHFIVTQPLPLSHSRNSSPPNDTHLLAVTLCSPTPITWRPLIHIWL